MLRRVTTALLFAVLALAAWAPASALAQDNTAVAINTKDDSSLFELAFSIKQVSGEVVDQTNAAVAYANCERCQTVAIAIQVLIVMTQGPDTVTPTNLAVALNEECSACTTMALAYQFVLGGEGPLELTATGRRAIARIRRALRRLGRPGLSAEAIRDRTAALVEELRGVLATELVPVERDSDGEGRDDLDGRDEADEEPLEDEDTEEGEEPTEPVPPEQPAPSTTPTETAPEPAPPPGTETETQPEPAPEPEPEQPAPETDATTAPAP